MTLPANFGWGFFFFWDSESACLNTLVADLIRRSKWCTCYYSLYESRIILKHLFSLKTLLNSCLKLFFSKVMKNPCGTNMGKLWMRGIWNTDVFEMLVDVTISSHMIRQFSSKTAYKVLTFRWFGTLSCWLGLGVSSADKRLPLEITIPSKNR